MSYPNNLFLLDMIQKERVDKYAREAQGDHLASQINSDRPSRMTNLMRHVRQLLGYLRPANGRGREFRTTKTKPPAVMPRGASKA